MASIRHFPASHPLPDGRNLGVALRLLLGGNLLALLVALAQAPSPAAVAARFGELAALVEPLLLLLLVLLAALHHPLSRLPLRLGQASLIILAAVLAGLLRAFAIDLGLTVPDGGQSVLLTAAGAALLLFHFELRQQSLRPAQGEARLAALNARIRPHFLFNSLNAVLSLIRQRPQQAEEALESLADLFRAAMRDPAERVRLSDEIALGRQYLDLERLRLGERLGVDWAVEAMPDDPFIPPLMLQPLLENAVYHGIEPRPEGGCIRIGLARRGDELRLSVANPSAAAAPASSGHQLALNNIRERLALYYDLEARLEIEAGADRHEVTIVLPCRPPQP